METTVSNPALPTKTLILIALAQGLGLLFLHQSIELKYWLSNEPQWIFALYSAVFIAPTILLLGLTDKAATVFKLTAGYAVIVLGLGYYMGLQATPIEHIRYSTLLTQFIITLCIATFKALMYIQHFSTGKPLSYSQLFLLSWRNFLTLGLSLLFTLCTWGVLMLWAGLFKAIRIEFFYDLFTNGWFFYPVLALANGFGVIIFRHQTSVIDTITRIQQALMKFLLVMLALISIIFLATLPFTGLQPLWETGGSTLILGMQAVMLFFINAVYQDDPKTNPYNIWVHRFIYLGVALLPIYSAISFYGLSLRVDQYGWSLSRCWGFLLWSIFAVFSLGYLWGIVRKKDNWLEQLSWVNVRMGLLVLGLMLVVNSPILDFRKISTQSQINRLDNGAVTLENFDYNYLHYNLASPGYKALQALKEKVKESHPEIALRISSYHADKKNNDIGVAKDVFINAIEGTDASTPKSLTDNIYKDMSKQPWRIKENQSYQLLNIDLNSNGTPEYILVEVRELRIELTMYSDNGKGDWDKTHLQGVAGSSFYGADNKVLLLKALKEGDYRANKRQWDNLQIGGNQFLVP